MKILLWILIGVGIFFSLPSTMYMAVFKGIFGREKLPEPDLKSWCRGNADLEKRYANALETFRGLELSDVTIRAFDGKKLHGAHLNRGSDKLMILMHGYRTKPEINFAPQIQDFLAQGYDLLVADQRAHGRSEGLFCSMGPLEGRDVLKWIEWAPYEKVVVYGMSMGCAAVGHASGKIPEGKVRALIMDCGFSNFYDELNYKCDLWHMSKAFFADAENLLSRIILRVSIRENTVDSLAQCRIPVFFLHGSEDDEVLEKEIRLQHEACAADKRLCIVDGAPHALAYAMGGDEVRDEISGFLARCTD